MLRRILFFLVLIGLGFIVYRYFDPIGADNLLEKVKNISNIFSSKNGTGDTNNISISGQTVNITLDGKTLTGTNLQINNASGTTETTIADKKSEIMEGAFFEDDGNIDDNTDKNIDSKDVAVQNLNESGTDVSSKRPDNLNDDSITNSGSKTWIETTTGTDKSGFISTKSGAITTNISTDKSSFVSTKPSTTGLTDKDYQDTKVIFDNIIE